MIGRAHLRKSVLIAGGSLPWFDRLIPHDGTCHLYSHTVSESERSNFLNLVDDVAKLGTIVSYSDSLSPSPGRRFALSFDDGFDSGVWVGEALAQRGISACFFPSVGVIGERDPSKVASFFGRPQRELPMTWEDLDRLVELGHEIGSHSMQHRPLASLSKDRAEHDLFESQSLIASRLGSCKHFAWPFGTWRHVHDDVVSVALRAGYETVASAVRGWHVGSSSSDGAILRNQFDGCDPVSQVRGLIAMATRSQSPLPSVG